MIGTIFRTNLFEVYFEVWAQVLPDTIKKRTRRRIS